MLDTLFAIVLERKNTRPEGSYTTSLFESGIDRIAQKVGEEGVEVVIAAKNDNDKLLVGEISDLLYHLTVLMAERNITPADVAAELERRHAEKTR